MFGSNAPERIPLFYLNGLNAYLDVIDAERTLYDSQMSFSNMIAAQYINYINLCKALGGNFE